MIQTEKMVIKQQQRQATTKQGCHPTLKWCCGKSARDFMATGDSNGQRGRYPLFTSFFPFHTWTKYDKIKNWNSFSDWLFTCFYNIYIISLIALNYGNSLASWIYLMVSLCSHLAQLAGDKKPQAKAAGLGPSWKIGAGFFSSKDEDFRDMFQRFDMGFPAFFFFSLLGSIWSSTYFFQRFDMEFPHV